MGKLEECVLQLYRIGVIKFGDFTLKSGMQSPIYFDLRMIISYPKLMGTVAELMWEVRPSEQYELVCGVAYTGLPIATLISAKHELPMLIRRKESKGYGTKKMVEGNYQPGQRCLMIEDVIVSGSSVYETVETLQELGLQVGEAVVFLDREHGGAANLTALNITVVPVLTMTQLLGILLAAGCVDQATHDSVMAFVASHSDTSIVTKGKTSCKQGVVAVDRVERSYESRAATTDHPLARSLFHTMAAKQTNLCVAADLTTSAALLELADQVGPHICLLKTHIDILEDFSADTTEKLQQLATKHNFLLFEDRKFGDIGKTVEEQYRGGVHRVADWAHLVTVHGLPGDGVVQGLMSGAEGRQRGCVLVSQMSSVGALTNQDYVAGCTKIAEANPYFVVGFVSQSSVSSDPRLILFTPGVQLDKTGDGMGQQYVSPQTAVLDRGADVIIVGRGVTEAPDPAAAAHSYQQAAFSAYLTRVSTLSQER